MSTPAERKRHAEWMRGWRARNPEAVLASQRAYRLANAEKIAAKTRIWRLAHVEQVREYNRQYMRGYRLQHPERVYRSHHLLYGPRIAFFNSLKAVPCADCNRRFPPYVMDFDHVRGTKQIDLSKLRRRSMQVVREEAAKCDVVCANCHRIRTFTKQQKHLTGQEVIA